MKIDVIIINLDTKQGTMHVQEIPQDFIIGQNGCFVFGFNYNANPGQWQINETPTNPSPGEEEGANAPNFLVVQPCPPPPHTHK